MHFVSYPATAMPSRWRPDSQVGSALSGWTPAARQGLVQSRRLAQGTQPVGARETPTELMVSVGTALSALTAGLILAFASPRGSSFTWVGIMAATVGGLKLLQTGSKLA